VIIRKARQVRKCSDGIGIFPKLSAGIPVCGDFDGADPAAWVGDREVIHAGFGVVVVLIDRAVR
jgi:hypothetical protein